jgi:hypothetical protein
VKKVKNRNKDNRKLLEDLNKKSSFLDDTLIILISELYKINITLISIKSQNLTFTVYLNTNGSETFTIINFDNIHFQSIDLLGEGDFKIKHTEIDYFSEIINNQSGGKKNKNKNSKNKSKKRGKIQNKKQTKKNR